ncbi:protein-disulfide reductase DsbD [Aliikangiella coralliicola]|nr:protein-disulfide reductase DsbD [Aliikangiella coralliicola]
MKSRFSKLLFLLTISLFGGFSAVHAEESDLSKLFAAQTEFLKVDEAFKLTTEIVDQEIIAKFEIADEYYMYRSRFFFSADGATLGSAYIPAGKKKVDEYLGNVEVYYNHLEISVPFAAHQKEFTFIIEFQGCAEAGLCYPPEEKKLQLFADTISPKGTPTNTALTSSNAQGSSNQSSPAETTTRAGAADGTEFVPEQEKVVNFLTDKSLYEIVAYFVLLGIGLAFTPCVLPMVPILSSIIVGQGKSVSTGKAFGLSLAYTQAMAIPYTIIGVLVGAAGSSFVNTFQEPLFIIIAAVIFVLLSLSMFGFYELQLPQSMQNRLNNISNSQEGGSYLGAAIMGAISALVVSPCVTVPLAGVLLYIAQTGDQLIGGAALYSLALGMGIPLLIVGVGGGKILPKAGAWMNAVKGAFGVGMLGLALYISKHLIPGPIYLFAWAMLLIVSSIYMGALSQVNSNGQKLWKGVGLVFFTYGIILILGSALGNGRLFSPLANLNQIASSSENSHTSPDVHAGFKLVKTIADVEREIKQANAQGKTVMFDFFAESCTACYEFADFTFPDPKVKAALKNTVLIQADVTKNDSIDKALMEHYGVVGLPSILFFNHQGKEDKRLRAIGFEGADIFVQRINAAFK